MSPNIRAEQMCACVFVTNLVNGKIVDILETIDLLGNLVTVISAYCKVITVLEFPNAIVPKCNFLICANLI